MLCVPKFVSCCFLVIFCEGFAELGEGSVSEATINFAMDYVCLRHTPPISQGDLHGGPGEAESGGVCVVVGGLAARGFDKTEQLKRRHICSNQPLLSSAEMRA